MNELGNDKAIRYAALVQKRKTCRLCNDLTNPANCRGGEFDCDEIGAWSRWQGNLNAQLLVVGQDWGDVAWFERERGNDTSYSKTNRTLVELLAAANLDIELPSASFGRGLVFLTNAILCLKEGGAQARVHHQWFRNCGTNFLRPLIEVVRPAVVVCLGERAYRGLLGAWEIRPGKFADAVNSHAPVKLPNDIYVFPAYHCGARVLNTHRHLEAQRADWREIGRFMRTIGR